MSGALRVGVTAFASIVVTLTSACGGHDPGAGAPPREDTVQGLLAAAKERGASTEQIALLADGEVTLDEYRGAFRNFTTCVENRGAKVGNVATNLVDGWRVLSDVTSLRLSDSEIGDVLAECGSSEMEFVEVGYSVSHPDAMDGRLLTRTLVCLKSKGLKVTGEEKNMEDLVASVGSREAVKPCVIKELTAMDRNARAVFAG